MSTFNHHFLCIQEHQQVHIYWPYFRQNYEYHRFDITYVLGNQNDKRVTIKNSKLEMKRHKTEDQVKYVIIHVNNTES